MKVFFSSLSLVVCLCFSIRSAYSDLELVYVPRGRPFILTFPDPREVKMNLLYESDEMINANIGNYFSIIGLEDSDDDTTKIHFGLEGAGYFNLSVLGSTFPLQTVDGLIGLYLEGQFQDIRLQTRFTHISAHMGDGSTTPSIRYSREMLVGRIAYSPKENWALYFGMDYLVHTIPALNPWDFQAGGYYFYPNETGNITFFTALDVEYRTETVYNPSVSFEIGMSLQDPPLAFHSFRLFYNYYTGQDRRGQYYNQSFTGNFIGIEGQI